MDTGKDIIKYIIDNSKILNEYEYIEIFERLRKKNINYNENRNGIFINLNNVPIKILEELKDLIDYFKINKELMEEENLERKKYITKISKTNEIENNFIENDKIEIDNNPPLINIKEGIKYNKNNDFDLNELFYTENNLDLPILKN